DVEYLVVNDSKKGKVKLDVKDIGKSKTFVDSLVKNQYFIDEITKKEEFITNIKKVQAYGSIVDQLDTENVTKVKYAKKFNNGKVNSVDVLLTETLTPIDRIASTGSPIVTTPSGDLTYYTYKDETGVVKNITVSQDVSNDFKTIVNQGDNKTVIENISKSSNLYSTTSETVVGKFNDKDVVRYVIELNQANSFTAVELPKAIDGMILEATLINKGTNAIVRGVIGKQVSGSKTTLSIGTVGTIITNNPAGNYCVIVEYVK
ncbi:MAG: hypothetical protein LBI72_14825, partial [Flavobacteriaceae bacterium]|nr:hypothetical protein [Flavobacteriaceae bacterium]